MALGVAIILLVYGLGAASIYVRRFYGDSQSSYPTLTPPARLEATASTTPEGEPALAVTITLVPTITPRPQ